MALHVLFRDLEDFGDTLLGLFTTMLGDTGFFDEFSGGRYDSVATILVVFYLFIVTIMLLNLLVAILSTAHDRVQEDVEGEFRVSNARIVDYYRTVVDERLLPVPFNLVQLVLSLVVNFVTAQSAIFFPVVLSTANGGASERQRGVNGISPVVILKAILKAVQVPLGQIVFWLVLGPVAVAGGTILWGLSGFLYAHYVLYIKYNRKFKAGKELTGAVLESMPLGWRLILTWGSLFWWYVVSGMAGGLLVAVLVWCVVGAPFCLLLMWLFAPGRALFHAGCVQPATFVKKLSKRMDGEPPVLTCKPTIESMLREGREGVGAEKLHHFLDNPMDDEDVRQDEKGKHTTVEHIKLLRNRLERTTKEELGELRNAVVGRMNDSFGKLRPRARSYSL